MCFWWLLFFKALKNVLITSNLLNEDNDYVTVIVRGSPAEKGSSLDSVHGLEALEGFVVGLYAEAFNALISLINR